jgi:three-Cys-motif partner protein
VESFFEKPSEQSIVKATIVTKYFWPWANIVIDKIAKPRGTGIGYVDLFCGPGRYEDQTESTPLRILGKALESEDMRMLLRAVFSDANPSFVDRLGREIAALPGVEGFRTPPEVLLQMVDADLTQRFGQARWEPTLFFVDPYGYKGISLGLLASMLQSKGCECILFFNMNRIRPALANPVPQIKAHMDALFGPMRAASLRQQIDDLSTHERELAVLEAMSDALEEAGAQFALPFRFKDDSGARTSHYLIHASKDIRGYGIMKDIMAGESSLSEEGVASFEYSPADERFPRLSQLSRRLDELGQMLLEVFAGEILTRAEIFEKHNVGTPFVAKNYRKALIEMEARGDVTCIPPADKRPRRKGEVTFSEDVRVKFPPKA